jgi:hypothetical protein
MVVEQKKHGKNKSYDEKLNKYTDIIAQTTIRRFYIWPGIKYLRRVDVMLHAWASISNILWEG